LRDFCETFSTFVDAHLVVARCVHLPKECGVERHSRLLIVRHQLVQQRVRLCITYMYTHTHSLSLSLSLSHTHTHTHTCLYVCMYTLSLSLSLSHTHTHSHTHTLTHTHSLTHSHTHTHTHTHHHGRRRPLAVHKAKHPTSRIPWAQARVDRVPDARHVGRLR